MSTAATSTDPASQPRRHPWRENIEALVVAIAVALLFKYFVLEISKIPSGSMQPTLMGNPETRVFDRVLVDKLSMRIRDPRRFEIVVFKHPVENSRIMVKRLVGMPGEELRIRNGDLWTRASEDEPWKILRKPEAVQETAWRALDVDDLAQSPWTQILGDAGWRLGGHSIRAPGPGTARYRAGQESIRDRYTDGYPDALRSKIRPQDRTELQGKRGVGDLRVRGEIEAAAQLEALVVRLTEDRFAYEFRIPGPAADPGARPSIEVRESGNVVTRIDADEPLRLPSGRSLDFATWNADDRVSLRVGDVRLAVDVAPVVEQRSSVFLELVGGGAELTDLGVDRDVHYVAPNASTWEVEIPEGHYVMLGDNTQDSADSRDWRAVQFTFPGPDGEPRRVAGNYRKDENPIFVDTPDGQRWTRFRDKWGEVHWFLREDGSQGLPYWSPLVPRELIQGRAVATFWPLKPWKGIWRLGWLH